MNRIKPDSTFEKAIVELCEGNAGAVVALARIAATSNSDPANILAPLHPFLMLDKLRIYGWKIHVLFKHICGSNPIKVRTLLNAVQLGYLSGDLLKQACDREDGTAKDLLPPIETLYEQVKERIVFFDLDNEFSN